MRAYRQEGEVLIELVVGGAVAAAYVARRHITTPYDPLFERKAHAHELPADLLRALAYVESSFRPRAVSKVGAMGLMQIMPAVAAHYGYSSADMFDPEKNVEAACRLLLDLKRELGNKLSTQTWLAAYNAGSPAILRRGIFNPEYVASVMLHWQLYAIGALFR